MKFPRGTMHLLIATEILALIAVFLIALISPIGGKIKDDVNSNKNENIENDSGSSENDLLENEVDDDYEIAVFIPSQEIADKVSGMTLEEKVAQLFIITPEELAQSDVVTIAGNATREAVNSYPVGGLIYSQSSFRGTEQTRKLLSGVQTMALERIGIPMFLMVEEQGGELSPVAVANGYAVQKSQAELGREETEGVIVAEAIATYLKESGFNMVLGPNTDLAVGIDATADGRTFGTDAEVGKKLVTEMLAAYHANGIMTLTGTFPGLGYGVTLNKELKQWETEDALLYQASVESQTQAMMIGFVTATELTKEEGLPCCFSKETVKYIRGKLGYTGLLVTEDIASEKVAATYSAKDAAVKALESGITMIYCSGGFREVYQGVLDAVAEGTLSEEVINEAVARILTSKENIEVENNEP